MFGRVYHDAITCGRAPESRGARPPLPELSRRDREESVARPVAGYTARATTLGDRRRVGRIHPGVGRAILKRYNTRGPDALRDGRRDNGTDPLLSAEQRAELFAALEAEPPDGGLWSGPKVAASCGTGSERLRISQTWDDETFPLV